MLVFPLFAFLEAGKAFCGKDLHIKVVLDQGRWKRIINYTVLAQGFCNLKIAMYEAKKM